MLSINRMHRFFETLDQSPWDAFFSWPMAEPGLGPHLRLWSSDEGVILEVDLPGRRLEDLEVTTEQNRLLVEVKRPLYEQPDGWQFRARERSDGNERTEFRLPFAARSELTDVVYQNGIVRITVKKPAEEQPRKLTVHG